MYALVKGMTGLYTVKCHEAGDKKEGSVGREEVGRRGRNMASDEVK
jgi:hypothetical protein